jgi:restriction endonuclease Mrr
MDHQTQQFLEAFGAELEEQLDRVYTLSILQTRVLLNLATALKSEKKVSLETHKAADKALETIDQVIDQLDESVAGLNSKKFDVKAYLGGPRE